MNSFELQMLNFIQNHFRNGPMDFVMKYVSLSGTGGAVWLFVALILFLQKDKRVDAIMMFLSLGISVVLCSVILKPLIARTRPCDLNSMIQLLVSRPLDYSFPSGHTAAAFAAASCLFFRKSKLWLYLTVLAFVMAFSRMYLYVHFPTDILAGLILGIACGWTGYKVGGLPAFQKTPARTK